MAAGAVVPDREWYRQGFHMERFVKQTRMHGEPLDLSIAL